MKFCCSSNAAMNNVKIAKEKYNIFPKIFKNKTKFSQKYRFLEKKRFSDFGSSFCHFDYSVICL